VSGTFVLSLDTEIAWGTLDEAAIENARWSFDNYRPLFRELLDLLDERRCPATWAVVGHLFLDTCDGHPELPQPHYAGQPAPDSARDPKTNLARDPWYYGRDVLELLRASPLDHDIGSHSFTHVLAGDAAVTRDMWEAQLRSCAQLHRAAGLPMESFVFPRNQVAHVALLPEYGVRVFRGVEPRWYRRLPAPAARALHLVDRASGWAPRTFDPRRLDIEHGVVNLPASQFLMTYDGVRRAIPTRSRVSQARRGLKRAVKGDGVFHLWFHPFNLGLGQPGRMLEALARILEEVDRLRSRGDLEVQTMAQVAARRLEIRA
jgi:peptidoglycan/xylan/chitin deacetylase (PgdA/CDA1 family)